MVKNPLKALHIQGTYLLRNQNPLFSHKIIFIWFNSYLLKVGFFFFFFRGYYRCSSSKGCLARKQVERNRADPGMFIVTYTAEHNHPAPTHRNSLAGSTRQKPSTSQTISGTAGAPNNPDAKPSSPATSAEEELAVPQAQSTTTESKDGPESVLMDDEDENDFGFSDMAVSDDFFVGLEGLGGPADYFPTSFSLPWVASNAATAAGGS